jgi:hypothetical protein
MMADSGRNFTLAAADIYRLLLVRRRRRRRRHRAEPNHAHFAKENESKCFFLMLLFKPQIHDVVAEVGNSTASGLQMLLLVLSLLY